MVVLERDYFEAAIAFFNNYQDQTQLIAALSARIEELEKFKQKIEKLPYYAEWVAAYNCDGYQD